MTATIGDNNPPPHVAHALHIEELYQTAKDFLDGEPITTEGQATEVGRLIAALREARKGANEQRATEKRPHDDAAKAVQTAWKPLLDQCDRAMSVAKNALVPYQTKIEAEQRAEATRLAQEAKAAQIAAQEALEAQRGSGRLEDAEQSESALKVADKLAKDAARADKAKPLVATGGRSIGLRDSYRTEVTDYTAFSRWAWERRREEYEQFLDELATKEGKRGPVPIPGIIVHTERKAA